MAVAALASSSRALALGVRAARPPPDSGKDAAGNKKRGPKQTTYEVKRSTPPQPSLGTHKFPSNTHCGDTIELRNRFFVVDKVTYHYSLQYGKCKRDDTRLYVQEATRYLLNKHLDALLEGEDAVKDDERPGNAANRAEESKKKREEEKKKKGEGGDENDEHRRV